MLSQASKSENLQDETTPQNNVPVIMKTLSWYLEGYDEPDRYDWGSYDEPKGRELF